jgi:3-hydroxybutyrate dehydrogenase
MGILKGKVAVVTGSTSGIGLAYARAFAGAGASIVLNGMGAPTEVEKERSAIESDFGVKAVYSSADMAKPSEIAELITLGENTFGSVDVLVNNAGVQHVAPIEEFPVDKWNAIIGINLSSAFQTIRAAVPGMKRRGWGRIITTASAHSLVASPFKSPTSLPSTASRVLPRRWRWSSPGRRSPVTASAPATSGRRWWRRRSRTR